MATGEKIVIVGAGSFLGYHLSLYFKKLGYRVTGTTFLDTSDIATIRLRNLRKAGIQLSPLDMTNTHELETFILSNKPDYWVHHAGWAVAYGSRQYDLEHGHQVNVTPLSVLYKAFAQTNGKGILVTGTNAEYSDKETAATEDDVCWPSTPYGLSKLTETLRAVQLAKEYDIPTRVARVFIPFGALDAPGKLLPSVVASIHRGKAIDLSPCLQKRDFLFVDDLSTCYGALLKDLKREVIADVFNVCSGQATTLKKLILGISKQLCSDPALLNFGAIPYRQGEAPIVFGCNTKAKTILGWHPQSLETGIKNFLKQESL